MCARLHWDRVGWGTQFRDGRWVPRLSRTPGTVFARREWETSKCTKRSATACRWMSILPVMEAARPDWWGAATLRSTTKYGLQPTRPRTWSCQHSLGVSRCPCSCLRRRRWLVRCSMELEPDSIAVRADLDPTLATTTQAEEFPRSVLRQRGGGVCDTFSRFLNRSDCPDTKRRFGSRYRVSATSQWSFRPTRLSACRHWFDQTRASGPGGYPAPLRRSAARFGAFDCTAADRRENVYHLSSHPIQRDQIVDSLPYGIVSLTRYSITLVSRTMISGGILIPSALALLELTIRTSSVAR